MSRRTMILDAQYELDRMFDSIAELREDEDERRRLFDTRIGHVNRHAVQIAEMLRSLARADETEVAA